MIPSAYVLVEKSPYSPVCDSLDGPVGTVMSMISERSGGTAASGGAASGAGATWPQPRRRAAASVRRIRRSWPKRRRIGRRLDSIRYNGYNGIDVDEEQGRESAETDGDVRYGGRGGPGAGGGGEPAAAASAARAVVG